MTTAVNTNEQVRVILTETGARIYNADVDETNRCLTGSYRVEHKAAGDLHETSLWRLMQLYGPHIHMGMREVPFLDNVLEILQ